MRVNYYNKINFKKLPDRDWIPTSSMKIPNQGTVYFFDLKEYVRFYPSKFLVRFLFGDITKIPKSPSFVKTRPIKGDNENSVFSKNFINIDQNSHIIIIEKFDNKISSNMNIINYFDIKNNSKILHLIFQENG